MGIIYKISSPTKKIYVGKTYDLRKRINCHKHASKKDSNIILHNSIGKHGWENHVLEIIEEVDDSLLNEREMFWIEELKTYCYDNPNGMNMTKGGDGQRTTWIHDIKRREKQSKRYSGKGNPFFGKRHTKEFIDKKSKEVSIYNKEIGKTIPEWGAEKGRDIVRRKVLCYSGSGDFIKEYISVTEASNELSLTASSISATCNLKRTNVGGYVFRYKKDNYPSKIDVSGIKHQIIKRPIYWLSEDLEVITEFPSALEASAFFGLPKTTINRAAMYNDLNPIRTGHVFCYKDKYLKEYCLKTA